MPKVLQMPHMNMRCQVTARISKRQGPTCAPGGSRCVARWEDFENLPYVGSRMDSAVLRDLRVPKTGTQVATPNPDPLLP